MTGFGAPAGRPDRAAYEIHVGGRLGPLMLASLPHEGLAQSDERFEIVVQAEGSDLVDITEQLVGRALVIDHVCEIEVAE
jgi:hypothetical protein